MDRHCGHSRCLRLARSPPIRSVLDCSVFRPCRYALTGDCAHSHFCVRHCMSYLFLYSSQRRQHISEGRKSPVPEFNSAVPYQNQAITGSGTNGLLSYRGHPASPRRCFQTRVLITLLQADLRLRSEMIMRGEGQVMAESRMTNCKCQERQGV